MRPLRPFLMMIALFIGPPLMEAAERPNFLIFLVDDMGWVDPECYGNPFHETPHINRLASQGMKFTDAYAACPVCSPTRASILTGKYPATLNLTDFIPGHWRPWEKLVVPKMNLNLPLAEKTFAELLKPAGYVSGSFGKWHLGAATHYPGQQGFDEFTVTGGRHFAPKFKTTPQEDVPDGTYLANYLTDKAEDFLERHQSDPFVLYLPHYAVHIPLEAEEELISKYEQKTKTDKRRVNNPTYAAMVEHIDHSLGRIMKKLDDLQLSENTVVIFFSDNGGLYQRFDKQGEPVMVNLPLRDEKGSLYEGGIRVPLIVRWPSKIAAGTVCDTPVSSVDFVPTMLELAGVDQSKVQIDGQSLVPLLTEAGTLSREGIYWHYPHYHHTSPAGAVRAGDWKLIEYFDEGRVELYNLKDDIGESTDLAQQHPQKAQELQHQLVAWRKRVGAKMPTVNPAYDAAKADQFKRRPR
ncbi:MAG: sulfatase [Planctomycetaceae bacterium]|nr:sulfatase [Planctomycetaceae bacterium]MDG2389126.1 sulfatase [Planctomycetaceae bacterium]